MRTCLTLAILTSVIRAQAADVWIDVVGIDQVKHEQSYQEFYTSAQNFEAECKTSIKKPSCFLFLNEDPQLAPLLVSIPKGLSFNQGQPESTKLSQFILNKIMTAKSDDTVIISLNDHGAPVPNRSAACVWLSAQDYFCESDLIEILKKKPPGVKVFIDAAACFSGDFSNLSNSEVCVATASNRLNVGSVSARNLWASLSFRHPQTLTDLQEPIFKESGHQRFLGSQLMLNQLCRKTREKLGPDATTSMLSTVLAIPVIEPNRECRDMTMTAPKVSELISVISNSLSSQKEQTCKSLSLPNVVCSARSHLIKADSELRSAMTELNLIDSKERRFVSDAMKNLNSDNKLIEKIHFQLKSLSPAEQKEFEESFELGLDPDWQKFSHDSREVAQKIWPELAPLLAKVRDAYANKAKIDQIISELKQKGYYQDLITLQTCLYENAPSPAETHPELAFAINYYRNEEVKFPEKQFTEKDYTEARKCEDSIHF